MIGLENRVETALRSACTVADIANGVGVCEATAARYIKKLVAAGTVEKIGGGKGLGLGKGRSPNLYRRVA